jgi:hypothetical protein
MHAEKCGTGSREKRPAIRRPCKDIWRSLEKDVFLLGNTPVTEIRPKMLKNNEGLRNVRLFTANEISLYL